LFLNNFELNAVSLHKIKLYFIVNNGLGLGRENEIKTVQFKATMKY